MEYTYETPQRVIQLKKETLIVFIWLFSILDAVFTDIGLRLSLIEEANPFVEQIYEWNIIVFYLYKFVFPVMLLVLYPLTKNKKWIDRGIIFCFFLYLIIVMYHLLWITLVLII